MRFFLKADARCLIVSFVLCLSLTSCSSAPTNIQPQINSLIVSGRHHYALNLLEQNKLAYGENNQLLYHLDRGMIYHLMGRYRESTNDLNKSKDLYDRLYTISLSKQFKTWLINDNYAPYRGEDYERVMINVFQALNYFALGELDEALVEARDVDDVLNLINRQYRLDQRNVYSKDAFIRFLMGLIYEASPDRYDLNDALISYQNALQIYLEDNLQSKVTPPKMLIENLLSVADHIHFTLDDQIERLVNRERVKLITLAKRRSMAEVYFVEYVGNVPIKRAALIPLPVGDGRIIQFSFPYYDRRKEAYEPSTLIAQRLDGGGFSAVMEDAQNIGVIAIQSLDNRKARVLSKAAARAVGKHLLTKSRESRIENEHGETVSKWFKYLSNLYQITSEQPDLRSWLTLPDRIRIGRLLLPEGEYKIGLEGSSRTNVMLKSGDVRILWNQAERY